MTVAALPSTVSYLENGVTVAFPVPFRFNNPADLIVDRIIAGQPILQQLGLDYTVTGGATDAGGTVTRVGPTSGATLRIRRRTARQQPMIYATGDRFPAKSHEAALDRQMLIAQEHDETLGDLSARAVQVPIGETVAVSEQKLVRQERVAFWSTSGQLASVSHPALAAALATYLPANLRGPQGPRGRDTLELAWTESFQGTLGQTVFTTLNEFFASAVTVQLNGIELLRSDFTTTGTHTITLNTGLASAGWVTVKAFHLPTGFDPFALYVDDYGAQGDDVTDDTAAIQACFDVAPPGATIALTPGKTYRVNPNANPAFQAYGGVHFTQQGQTLALNGGELKALESPVSVSCVVHAYQKDDCSVIGPGKVTGEWNIHTASGGEFGHGIVPFNCDRFSVLFVEISNCWGDGVTPSPSFTGAVPDEAYCTNLRVEWNHIHDCRRNGVSVVAARRYTVSNNLIHDVLGTAPAGGIDCEPDNPLRWNANGTIENNTIYNVQVGLYLTVGNRDTLARGNNIVALNTAILLGSGCRNVKITGNPRLENTVGGAEGGAIRAIGNNAQGCSATDNDCFGGGAFLLESLAGDELHVRANRLNPTNTGCAGFARLLGSGSYEGNIGTMAANTGAAGVQFLQLNCRYGRNTHDYAGATVVGTAILAGTDVGGDYYMSPLLKRPNGSSGASPGILKSLRSINASVGGVGTGMVQVFALNGVNCLLNTIIPFADGGGEGGADPSNVGVWISGESATGANVNIKNRSSTQSLNLRLIVATGA